MNDLENTKNQIEFAIENNLYVAQGTRASREPAWWRPIRVEGDEVVMLWGDCGREDRPEDLARWSMEEWISAAHQDGYGLFTRVGMWNFAPAQEPAVGEIEYAHRHPDSAGKELYELKEAQAKTTAVLREYHSTVQRLLKEKELLLDALEDIVHWQPHVPEWVVDKAEHVIARTGENT